MDTNTIEDIKRKIAYHFHEEAARQGIDSFPSWNWVRASRIVEFFTTPQEDCPYYRRNLDEYRPFQKYFENISADGTKIDGWTKTT